MITSDAHNMMRKYSLLDDFGQKTIAAVLRMEFARCQKQGTLKSGKSVSVSVKVRDLPDELLTANTVEGE